MRIWYPASAVDPLRNLACKVEASGLRGDMEVATTWGEVWAAFGMGIALVMMGELKKEM